MKKLLTKYLSYFIIGMIVSIALNFPIDKLSIENSENFCIYKESKHCYSEYIDENKSCPKNFDFLPEQIRNKINTDDYPLIYDNNNNMLSCVVRAPLNTTPSILNYIFPPTPLIVLEIGHVKNTK